MTDTNRRITVYRGYRIWYFDGYYDIHDLDKGNTTALDEGYSTMAAAKREIDEMVQLDRFDRMMGGAR